MERVKLRGKNSQEGGREWSRRKAVGTARGSNVSGRHYETTKLSAWLRPRGALGEGGDTGKTGKGRRDVNEDISLLHSLWKAPFHYGK